MTIAQIIKAIISSTTEAELGALYINCREAIPARHALIAISHPQPPTPMQTNNPVALGIIHKMIVPRCIKSMYIRFYWLRDQIQQLQLCHN